MADVSVYLRLVVGPIVVCDIELFASKPAPSDEPPPQLNGGTGTLAYAEHLHEAHAFGFRARPNAQEGTP